MSASFVIDIAVEINATDYDPTRLSRVAARFAESLPPGSQTLNIASAQDGVGRLRVRVPEPTEGMPRALYLVATALELAVASEPSGLDSLGRWRTATIEREDD